MGVNVQLESETGEPFEQLLDPNNRVAMLLPDWRDEPSTCLRFVDLYGDTVFNRLQVGFLIKELESAVLKTADPSVAEHGRAILDLARKCSANVHTYLRFLGD
jgi:hypothetical protein